MEQCSQTDKRIMGKRKRDVATIERMLADAYTIVEPFNIYCFLLQIW
jgi:hypothetical protein